MNKRIILYILPLFLILYVFIPKRTLTELPTIQSITLADSIPVEYYRQLTVVEKQGNRIVENGKVVTYLEYETDPDQLLKTIARLPFSMHAVRADTTCLEIGFYGFEAVRNSLSESELQAGAYYWSVKPEDYQRFECVKGNEKHTLLIRKDSDQVMHRIEYTS